MSAAARTLRSRLRREDGISLAELVVAMAILSIVMLVFTSTLAGMQRAVVEEDVRSRLNDDARLAMQSIDRQVRSGNLLYDPSSEIGTVDPFGVGASAPGYLFRVYTQAQFGGDEDPRCAAWFVDDDRQLLYRYWPPLDEDSASDWQVVATGIVNRDEALPPFVIDSTGRTLTVEFVVNPEIDTQREATQTFEAALTGRNTSFGYPSNLCADLPPDM